MQDLIYKHKHEYLDISQTWGNDSWGWWWKWQTSRFKHEIVDTLAQDNLLIKDEEGINLYSISWHFKCYSMMDPFYASMAGQSHQDVWIFRDNAITNASEVIKFQVVIFDPTNVD